MNSHQDWQHAGRSIWEKMKAGGQTNIVVKYVLALEKDC
jgi:hypothetical protein